MFKFKRLISLVLIFFLIVFFAYASVEDKINDANQQLNNTQSELEKVNAEKNELENKRNELIGKLETVQEQIRLADVEIYELGAQIEIVEEEIANKNEELLQAEKRLSFQNDRMKKRLRALYKAGDLTYLEILLNSASLSDMMTQMDKIQILLDYDQETLLALTESRNFISQAKLELENKNIELLALREDEQSSRDKMAILEDDLREIQAECENDYRVVLALSKDLEEEANRLTSVLSKLEIERDYVAGEMIWPVNPSYNYISSDFGQRIHPVLGSRSFHSGLDIPAPGGTPIYAANSGVVIFAGRKGSYGNAVILDHGGGIVTLYAHSRQVLVSVGQSVDKGDTIALVGSTGRSTGNHVHFEVREGGQYVDPKPYLYGR